MPISSKTFTRPSTSVDWWFDIFDMQPIYNHTKQNYIDTGKIISFDRIEIDPLTVMFIIEWNTMQDFTDYNSDQFLLDYYAAERDPYITSVGITSQPIEWN